MERIEKAINYFTCVSVAVFCGIAVSFFSVNFISLAYNQNQNNFTENKSADFVVKNQAAAIGAINEYVERKVSMIFVGDIMLDRGVEYSVFKNADGDFSFIFEKAGFLKKADIVFGNLEGPISDAGKDIGNLYSFRMRPQALEALREAGFNVLSVANNHSADWGRAAFEDTISRLGNEKIMAVGGGWNRKDAERVRIIEKNGLKIGFLGFSDKGPNWMAADEDSSGILLVDENFTGIIEHASSDVDYLIVSIHFGNEYQPLSNNRQKMIARNAIDAGARVVVGHHPHVAQEIENYKDGVIAYSLGNFVFDQSFSEETMTGTAFEITVDDFGIAETRERTVKINEFFQPASF